jgi:hypothetical protein
MTDRAMADWVVDTCLAFGCTVATAYQVAGLFVSGVRNPPKRGNAGLCGAGANPGEDLSA